MELWEVKANALRLMFADSGLSFSKEEFENEVVYSNGNTRDKLTRMNDSIRRAIDLYYQTCGQFVKRKTVKYRIDDGIVTDFLDLTEIDDFGSVSRIDINKNNNLRIKGQKDVPYFFNQVDKEVEILIHIPDTVRKDEIELTLSYYIKDANLPDDNLIDELEFNLDSLNIPSDIQRKIPLYIKGEIYEEDEYALAQASKNEYIEYLLMHKRKYGGVQTKVRSIHRRG